MNGLEKGMLAKGTLRAILCDRKVTITVSYSVTKKSAHIYDVIRSIRSLQIRYSSFSRMYYRWRKVVSRVCNNALPKV